MIDRQTFGLKNRDGAKNALVKVQQRLGVS